MTKPSLSLVFWRGHDEVDTKIILEVKDQLIRKIANGKNCKGRAVGFYI